MNETGKKLADARASLSEARARLDSLLHLPAAALPVRSPEDELLEAIAVVRSLPMHGDVALVLDVVENYIARNKTREGA